MDKNWSIFNFSLQKITQATVRGGKRSLFGCKEKKSGREEWKVEKVMPLCDKLGENRKKQLVEEFSRMT